MLVLVDLVPRFETLIALLILDTNAAPKRITGTRASIVLSPVASLQGIPV
jgi:hypothetical protein